MDDPSGAWLIWQLADSAFPAGGFVHSGGLEAAVQLGEARGEALARLLADSLDQCGHAQLPFMAAVHAEPEGFLALDRHCDATLLVGAANRASRAQGAAMLVAAGAALESTAIIELRRSARVVGAACHWAPVFGAVTRHAGIGREEAMRLFLFTHLRGLISSAVRLGAVGPLEGQALQRRLAAAGEATLAACSDLAPNEATQTAPLLEVLQGSHDRLYSRLFSS